MALGHHSWLTGLAALLTSVCACEQGTNVYCLEAPAGAGKTRLVSQIVQDLHGQGKTVITVASAGVAALLLDDGRTAHSFFGIIHGKEFQSG